MTRLPLYAAPDTVCGFSVIYVAIGLVETAAAIGMEEEPDADCSKTGVLLAGCLKLITGLQMGIIMLRCPLHSSAKST